MASTHSRNTTNSCRSSSCGCEPQVNRRDVLQILGVGATASALPIGARSWPTLSRLPGISPRSLWSITRSGDLPHDSKRIGGGIDGGGGTASDLTKNSRRVFRHDEDRWTMYWDCY